MANEFQVVFHPLAAKEFEQAREWYRDRMPELGERFSEAAERRINQISKAPLLYSRRKHDTEQQKSNPFLT